MFQNVHPVVTNLPLTPLQISMIHADVKERPGLGATKEAQHKTLHMIDAYFKIKQKYSKHDKQYIY